MDWGIFLKSHGSPEAATTSDSDSGGKSDLDEDYYRYLPAPIPEEELLENSVTTKRSNTEKQENGVGIPISYSQMVQLPMTHSDNVDCWTTVSKATSKKKAKKKVIENGKQETPKPNTEPPKTHPQNGLSQQKQISEKEETMILESDRLTDLIKTQIRLELERLKLGEGGTQKETGAKAQGAVKKSITQSLPSIPQAVKQSTSTANKKTVQPNKQQNDPKYLVEAKKVEKIFNYVDAADKCLKGIIKKGTASGSDVQSAQHYNKLKNVLEYIQYAHKCLKTLSSNQPIPNNTKDRKLTKQ